MTQLLRDGVFQYADKKYGFSPAYGNITGYKYDFNSKGLAYTPSFGFGMTFEVNKVMSVYTGLRYVINNVSAKGSFKNLTINNPDRGGDIDPKDYLENFYQTEQNNFDVLDKFIFGLSNDLFQAFDTDRDIDVKQIGHGVTPMMGLNLSYKDKLNFGMKVEFTTKLLLKTKVTDGKDGGIYEDGSKIHSDLPGYYTVGLRYNVNKKFNCSVGHRYFFSRSANLNGRENEIKKNYYEITCGVEYIPVKKFKISGGATYNQMKVNDIYQNEVNSYNPGITIATGFAYQINPMIEVECGYLHTFYKENLFTKDYTYLGGNLPIGHENLNKEVGYKIINKTNVVGVGINFSFNKDKENGDSN